MSDERATDSTYPFGAMPLIRQKRRRLRLSLVAGLVLGPAIALAFTPAREKVAIYGWVIGGATSLMGVFLASVFWLDDRRILNRLAAFQRGEFMAHWH